MKAGGLTGPGLARARPAARPVTHTQEVDTWGLRWLDLADGPAVVLLDQTRLPAEETYLTCTDVASLVDAIGRLVVRGAPLLGLAGAFGVALAAYRGENVAQAAAALAQARPTAVNLGWGADRALAAYQAAQRAARPVPDAERPAAAGRPGRSPVDRRGGCRRERGHRGERLGSGPGPGPDPDPLQHRRPGVGGEGPRSRSSSPPTGGTRWPGSGWTRPGRCCRAPG